VFRLAVLGLAATLALVGRTVPLAKKGRAPHRRFPLICWGQARVKSKHLMGVLAGSLELTE
jgi:hypothetical protein